MKQKLIKINEQHYVVVDYNLEIKENSYFFANQGLRYCIRVDKNTTCPFITLNKNGQEEGHFHTWKGIVIYSTLLLHDVPLIALEDVEEVINNTYELFKEIDGSCNENEYEHWIFKKGFEACKELNKDKILNLIIELDTKAKSFIPAHESTIYYKKIEILKSLLPKTEWNVDVINDKIILL